MTRTIRILALLAAAGGACWLVKFAVIVATDGAEEGAADLATAVFFIAGVTLMAIGAATVTLRFAGGRATTVAAALAAPLLWAVSFLILDPIAQGGVGDAGPSWLQDESAIALTGMVWLAVGLASRSTHRLVVDQPAAR